MSPFTILVKKHKSVCARFLRVLIILIPVCLTAINVVLTGLHLNKYQNGSPRDRCIFHDFASVLAGPSKARSCYLPIFGGPYVAVPIFLLSGSVMLILPKNIARHLNKGLIISEEFVLSFLPSQRMLQELAGVPHNFNNAYEKFYYNILGQSLLVLNYRFWIRSFELMVARGKQLTLCLRTQNLVCRFLVIVFLPAYVLLCLLEQLWTLCYLGFPVINCFFITLKAYVVAAGHSFQRGPCASRLASAVFQGFVGLLFSYTWYIHCEFFFDSFWFVSKIIMFTYSGIIANPSTSFGYLILILTSVYYLAESIQQYGEGYAKLLRTSLEANMKFLNETSVPEGTGQLKKVGLHEELFHLIIEKYMPKRVYMFLTIAKFTLIIIMVGISVHLLITFDKLREISFVTHVFEVIFVCSVPKLANSLCVSANRRREAQQLLQEEVYKTIVDYHKESGSVSLCVNENTTIARTQETVSQQTFSS